MWHGVAPGRILALSFSPDGETLAAGSDHSVTFWNAVSGAPLHPIPNSQVPTAVSSLAYSPNGALLAIGSDTLIYLWDLHARRFRNILHGHQRNPVENGYGGLTSTAQEIDSNGRVISSREEGKVSTSGVTTMAFDPHGHYLAAVAVTEPCACGVSPTDDAYTWSAGFLPMSMLYRSAATAMSLSAVDWGRAVLLKTRRNPSAERGDI